MKKTGSPVASRTRSGKSSRFPSVCIGWVEAISSPTDLSEYKTVRQAVFAGVRDCPDLLRCLGFPAVNQAELPCLLGI